MTGGHQFLRPTALGMMTNPLTVYVYVVPHTFVGSTGAFVVRYVTVAFLRYDFVHAFVDFTTLHSRLRYVARCRLPRFVIYTHTFAFCICDLHSVGFSRLLYVTLHLLLRCRICLPTLRW